MVPEQVKRTVGVAANLLCDNATYLLGIDAKGKPERARRCFEAATGRHLALLAGGWFAGLQPRSAVSSKRGTLKMRFHPRGRTDAGGGFARWRESRVQSGRQERAGRSRHPVGLGKRLRKAPEGADVMTCLVIWRTSSYRSTASRHQGRVGAQAMGASLVGFNARAFESYGHDEEQGLNAPVSEYVTFAYTTALNYLLSDRNHHIRLGDTTIVYWADSTMKTVHICPISRKPQPERGRKSTKAAKMIPMSVSTRSWETCATGCSGKRRS